MSKPVDWVSHLASFRAIDVRGNISALFEWEDKDTLVSVSCSLQKGKKPAHIFLKPRSADRSITRVCVRINADNMCPISSL